MHINHEGMFLWLCTFFTIPVIDYHSDIYIAICTNPCINGGTCIEPDVCQCPEPYGGVTCADGKRIITQVSNWV